MQLPPLLSPYSNYQVSVNHAAPAAVGLETPESKASPLPPLIQPEATSAGHNHRHGNGEEQFALRRNAGDQAQTPEELSELRELQQVDRQVRAHEAAHTAVGGDLAGAAQLSFKRGPDGQNYAVAGEVSITSPKVPGDPEATLRRADQVRRAALAPADPSSQDIRVAASAAQIAAEARVEIAKLKKEQADRAETAGKPTFETYQLPGYKPQIPADAIVNAAVNLYA